jgi:hypothetical protein
LEAFWQSVGYILKQPWWVDVAKLVLGAIMLVASGLALWVSLKFPQWYDDLVRLEALATHARDDVMFEFTAARARLARVKESLRAKRQPPSLDFGQVLADNAAPILALVFEKERTLVQWGVLASKIGFSVIAQLFGRKRAGRGGR